MSEKLKVYIFQKKLTLTPKAPPAEWYACLEENNKPSGPYFSEQEAKLAAREWQDRAYTQFHRTFSDVKTETRILVCELPFKVIP